MRKVLIVAALTLAVSGCAKDPISSAQSNNPQLRFDHLADIEGCRLYRFQDDGYYHYLTICKSAETNTSTDGSCGKGCSRHDDISADTTSN